MGQIFQRGRTYRRSEVHNRFGGQDSYGIVNPARFPLILLFSGTGGRFGYVDEWEEGVFVYSGQGQVGDMTFTCGVVQDHLAESEGIHPVIAAAETQTRPPTRASSNISMRSQP